MMSVSALFTDQVVDANRLFTQCKISLKFRKSKVRIFVLQFLLWLKDEHRQIPWPSLTLWGPVSATQRWISCVVLRHHFKWWYLTHRIRVKICLTGKIKLGSHPDPASPGPPYSAAARIKRYKQMRVLSIFLYVLIIENRWICADNTGPFWSVVSKDYYSGSYGGYFFWALLVDFVVSPPSFP